MLRIILLSLLTTIFAVITGCTTVTAPTPSPLQQPWETRQATLARIHSWQLNGKIAVQTAHDSGSASVDWIQNQNHFNIALLGPLGTNGLKLSGQPGLVSLETSDGKHLTAKSPEQLLAKQWGWNLPVSNLNYWIRGLPAPGPHDSEFDTSHRLSRLVQQGWNIQYLSYMNMGKLDLPNRIVITSPSLKTKIIVYHWKLGQA